MVRVGDGIWESFTARWFSGLLLALFAGWPAAPVSAETLVFRNVCNTPLVVQVAGVCHGVYHRHRPYLLRPGEATTPGIVLSGNKVLTIYDAKSPNCVLYQGALPSGSLDQYFRILPDVPPPRVRLQTPVPPAP